MVIIKLKKREEKQIEQKCDEESNMRGRRRWKGERVGQERERKWTKTNGQGKWPVHERPPLRQPSQQL